MKKFSVAIFLFLTYCSSIGFDIENSLNCYWEDHCQKGSSCQLDLKNLTPFDWDELYFFSGAASLEDIEEVLRFKLDSFTDTGDRLIFVQNKKIVYHKEWFKKPESSPKGIIFEIPGKYKIFDKKDAIFSLSKNDEMIVMKEVFQHSKEVLTDAADRLVKKKVPGMDFQYMKYNTRDLLVFSRDSNLVTANQCLGYTFDDYGRILESGLVAGFPADPNAAFTFAESQIKNYYDGYDGSTQLSLTEVLPIGWTKNRLG